MTFRRDLQTMDPATGRKDSWWKREVATGFSAEVTLTVCRRPAWLEQRRGPGRTETRPHSALC